VGIAFRLKADADLIAGSAYVGRAIDRLSRRPWNGRWERRTCRRLGLLPDAFALAAAVAFCSAGAPAPRPIRYEVDLRHPSEHLVLVRMTVPDSSSGLQIQFPAWNALYQIRDFVKNVQDLSATCDDEPISPAPVDVDTWQMGPRSCASLVVSYAVYADQESVFSAVLNEKHAFLNLAQVLFYLPAERARSARVHFTLPEGWKLSTAFAEPPTGGVYAAPNYDSLVDSPVEAGTFDQFSYRQSGAEYRVVVDADGATYPSDKLLDALKKITSTETALMQDVPFRRYTFIFHFFARGGGGMEHAYGTAIGFPAGELASNFEGLESTAAHEFFHAWNVKRIRPQGLEPVNYVRGNDTRDLWFSEGVTSTYEELTLVRSGLITRQRFYDRLAGQIETLEARPARSFQSAELSGIDAWLEGYPDYFRPERSISYYDKGELLGFLIDLGLRHASGDRATLDDLMRALNRDFAQRGRCFDDHDLEALLGQLSHGRFDATAFFHDYVAGTRELDYDTYLSYAGLELEGKPATTPDWGLRTGGGFGGADRVSYVEPGSNAERAGLQVGDVVTAVDHQPLTVPLKRLTGAKPGQKVELEVERHGLKLIFKFQLGSTITTHYAIVENPQATPEQLAIRNSWLEETSPAP
jgi:predicted metalloprotease with PDZ domain